MCVELSRAEPNHVCVTVCYLLLLLLLLFCCSRAFDQEIGRFNSVCGNISACFGWWCDRNQYTSTHQHTHIHICIYRHIAIAHDQRDTQSVQFKRTEAITILFFWDAKVKAFFLFHDTQNNAHNSIKKNSWNASKKCELN